MGRFAAVICGGGVAGIEGLLRLHRLAGDHVEVTLLCPSEQLFYRPEAVLEPFTTRRMRHYPIERIAADADARWVRDTLAWVDRTGHRVHTGAGHELSYDALLLAVGGRERTPVEHMDVFADHTASDTYRGILDDIEAGRITRIAYVRPKQPSWPLPLYELALLTAQRAREVNAHPDIVFITPESQPLHAFGSDASQAMTQLLRDAAITLHTGAHVLMPGPRSLILQPSGIQLYPDRTVTLPTITGPNIRGIPGEAVDRFLSVDEHCRVRQTDGRIFAAGDATDLPLKHGGLGAQQADTAAAGIAHLAGAAGSPEPLRPMIRGMLHTGGNPLYLAAHLIAGQGWRTELYEQPPWAPGEELVTAELGPYLSGLESAAPPLPASD
jgi:sulfide:quinone oxidoreductase